MTRPPSCAPRSAWHAYAMRLERERDQLATLVDALRPVASLESRCHAQLQAGRGHLPECPCNLERFGVVDHEARIRGWHAEALERRASA